MGSNRRGPNLTSRHFLETHKGIKPDKLFSVLALRALTFNCAPAETLRVI